MAKIVCGGWHQESSSWQDSGMMIRGGGCRVLPNVTKRPTHVFHHLRTHRNKVHIFSETELRRPKMHTLVHWQLNLFLPTFLCSWNQIKNSQCVIWKNPGVQESPLFQWHLYFLQHCWVETVYWVFFGGKKKKTCSVLILWEAGNSYLTLHRPGTHINKDQAYVQIMHLSSTGSKCYKITTSNHQPESKQAHQTWLKSWCVKPIIIWVPIITPPPHHHRTTSRIQGVTNKRLSRHVSFPEGGEEKERQHAALERNSESTLESTPNS